MSEKKTFNQKNYEIMEWFDFHLTVRTPEDQAPVHCVLFFAVHLAFYIFVFGTFCCCELVMVILYDAFVKTKFGSYLQAWTSRSSTACRAASGSRCSRPCSSAPRPCRRASSRPGTTRRRSCPYSSSSAGTTSPTSTLSAATTRWASSLSPRGAAGSPGSSACSTARTCTSLPWRP